MDGIVQQELTVCNVGLALLRKQGQPIRALGRRLAKA